MRHAAVFDEHCAIELRSPDRSDALLFDVVGLGHSACMETVALVAPCRPSEEDLHLTAERLGLTRAEAAVASLISAGMESQAIAEQLGLQPSTVKTYTKRALAKVGAHSRADLAFQVTWRRSPRRPPLLAPESLRPHGNSALFRALRPM